MKARTHRIGLIIGGAMLIALSARAGDSRHHGIDTGVGFPDNSDGASPARRGVRRGRGDRAGGQQDR